MADKLVTIAEYMDSIEAEMAKQVLADCGIQAILMGQNVGDGRIGFYETVKVQVRETDAEEARKILEEQEQPVEPGGLEEMDDLDEPEEEQ